MITTACLMSLIASAPAAGEPTKGNPPIVEPENFTIDEDTVLKGTVKAADPDGDRLLFVVGAPPKRGALTLDRATGDFAYTPWKNLHGEDSFKVWVSDGKLIGSAVMAVTVTAVDDPPELAGAALTLRVLEDVKGSTRLQASDADHDPLTFRIAADPEHGAAAVDGHGVVSYAPAHDFEGEDAFSVEVTAGGLSVTGDVRVVITAVNDAPTASAATASGSEDQEITGTLTASDLDGDVLSFRVAAPPKRGTVKLDGNSGAFSYTPWKDAHGADGFSFAASDGKLVGIASVSLTIAPVDDAPALVGPAPAVRAFEDGKAGARLLVKDVDGDALSFRIAKQAEHGEAKVDATGTIAYAPMRDYAGDDAFTVEADAGGGAVAAEIKVTVVATNDAPVASAATASGAEDEPITGTLGGTDVDGDALAYRVVVEPKRGSVKIDGKSGAFTYTPWKDAHGADGFSFAASDGKLAGTAPVSLTVAAVDDAPALVGPAPTLRLFEDGQGSARLLVKDVDGDAVSYRITKPPEHGEAKVDATGTLAYAPTRDYAGEDTFTVEAAAGGGTVAGEVKVTVVAINDAPVASAATAGGAEDEPITGTLVGSDVDGDALAYRVVAEPKRGSVKIDEKSGAFSYTPWQDAHGADGFSFAASDGKLVGTALVSLTIAPVDDPPALVGPALALRAFEDGKAGARLLVNDVDGDALSYRIAKLPEHGEAKVDATGTIAYAPTRDYAGEDAFTIEAAAGGSTVAADVTVTVVAINDAPVASTSTASGAEDEPITGTLGGTDVDGDALSYRALAEPKRGSLKLDEASGAWSYRPWKDTHGGDVFTFAATDGKLSGTATVALTVTPVDDPPVLVGPAPAVRAFEDGKADVRLLAKDVDGDTVSYLITKGAEHGEAKVDATGMTSYAPTHDYVGEDVFTVEAAAGGSSVTAEVKVTVVAINDAPVATSTTASGAEDEPITGTLGGTDVDGDALTYRVVAQPKRGSLKIDEHSGAWTFTPWKDAHGGDAFIFAATDGKLFGSAAVTLTVTPVDDPPVLLGPPAAVIVAEDGKAALRLNAKDVDGDAFGWRIASPPEHGEATVDAKGAVAYAPARDYTGDDRFSVEVTAAGVTASSEVRVTVTPGNDPPMVDAAAVAETQEDTVYRGRLPAADPDGDPTTFKITGKARLGQVALEDAATGTWSYTPLPDASGDDQVAFEVVARGQRAVGSARVHITPYNDAPTLAGVEASTLEEQPVEVKLAGADIDGDRMTYQVVAPPANGSATVTDTVGTVRVAPAKDFTGELAFDVVARDVTASSPPARVRVQVKPVNDAPQLQRLSLRTSEDISAKGKVLAVDVDGDALTYRVGEPSSLGEIVLAAANDGSFTFNPRKNASGTTVFTIVGTDPSGALGSSTVTVTVSAVDDPPVAVGARELASRNGRMNGRLSGYDPEGAPVRFRITSQPTIGQVELLDDKTGEYLFTTSGTGRGPTAFTFVVDDGGLVSAPARVDLLVR